MMSDGRVKRCGIDHLKGIKGQMIRPRLHTRFTGFAADTVKVDSLVLLELNAQLKGGYAGCGVI